MFKKYLHIGFAADTPNGLVVPVIRDAGRKDIYELARDLAELAGKARAGKLTAAEMQGGCFTISSLGGIGGTAFTPIINAPEVAILGVSRSQQRPVWKDGKFVPRLMMPLSLSYDHRVIDGAEAVRFVVALAEALGVAAEPHRGGALSQLVEQRVPDLGDFHDVEVIEVLVKAGDAVEPETPLITLETDKATMDVPATPPASCRRSRSAKGDRVSKDSLIALARRGRAATRVRIPSLQRDGACIARSRRAAKAPAAASLRRQAPPTSRPPTSRRSCSSIGAGPGGYTAAFRAADLGLAGHPGRPLAAARRRLPQRRLHPVEGAAACRDA